MRARYLKIKNNNLSIQIISTIIYRLLVDYCFISFISPLWAGQRYGHYTLKEVDLLLYLLSWFFLISTLILTIRIFSEKTSLLSLVIFLMYEISFIPFTTMMGLSVFPMGFCLLNFAYWMIFLGSGYLFLHSKTSPLIIKTNSNNPFYYTILLLSILGTIVLGRFSDFRLDLNIFNAYTYRDIARTYNYPFYFTYLLGLSRILIPVGIVVFIKQKKKVGLFVLIICAMINYSFDGGKTLFFITVVSIIYGFIYKSTYLDYLDWVFPGILGLGFIEHFFGSNYIFMLIVRRLLFVPQLINSYVYDFMRFNSPNYFSQLLRFIGVKGNGFDINYYIGAQYYDAPLMSANSGTIADALWQLKYIGIIIMPILIAFILHLIDKTTKFIPNSYLVIPGLIIAYYLNNSSITSALFSHGIFLFGIIMMLYKRQWR